jgi:hypothetical protein
VVLAVVLVHLTLVLLVAVELAVIYLVLFRHQLVRVMVLP